MSPETQAQTDDHTINQVEKQSKRRARGILTAGLSGLLGKVVAMLVSFVTVPITVRYLGAESYGLWITISSTVTMFFALDIGISSTLTNLISEAYARDDKEKAAQYFASAFWSIAAISALLGVIGWIIWPHMNWAAIFHVQGAALGRQTSLAMAAAFVVFLFSFPMGLVVKVLAGYQELHAANLFSTAGSVLALLIVLAVVHARGPLYLLVGGYAGSAVTANVACLIWMCTRHKPWMRPSLSRFRLEFVHHILGSGTQFFAIQIAGLIVFSSDNLVISHYLSPAQVTPYSVTWRLVNYIVIAQTFLFPALWPAFSEAWAAGQIGWIRHTYNRVRRITAGVLTVGCAATILLGRPFIRLWAGPAAVPPISLVWLMCVWIIIYAVTTNQSCIMGATSHIRKQAVSSVLAAVVNVILSILWVKTLGPAGVILATIVSYLIFIVAVQTYEVRRILRGDALPSAIEPMAGRDVFDDESIHHLGGI